MPAIILRIGYFAFRNWKLIAITVGLMAATSFMPEQAFRQAWATIENFMWMVVLILLLVLAGRLVKYFTIREERQKATAATTQEK